MAAVDVVSGISWGRYLSELIGQARVAWRQIILLGLLGVAAGLMVVVIHLTTGHFISDMTRDPAAVTGSEIYIGILSNVGILGWAAVAAVCFFSASLLSG